MSIENMSTTLEPVEVESTDKTPSTTSTKISYDNFTLLLQTQQMNLAEKIAEEFQLNISDIVEKCIPNTLQVAKKTSAKKSLPAPAKLTDYTQATIKEDLNSLTVAFLRDILKDHNIAISGAKTVLIERVWGILHPDEAPVVEKKRRGRKSKVETNAASDEPTELPDTNNEEEELEVSEKEWQGETYYVDEKSGSIYNIDECIVIGTWSDETGPNLDLK